MTIQVKCSHCGRDYLLADSYAGKNAKCKACGAAMAIPVGKSKSKRDNDLVDNAFVDEPDPPPRSFRSSSRKASRSSAGSFNEFLETIPMPARIIGGIVAGLAFVLIVVMIFGRSGRPRANPSDPTFAQNSVPSLPPGIAPSTSGPAGAATDPYDFTAVPLPKFPEPGPYIPGPRGGFVYSEVRFTDFASPGGAMRLRIRMPAGEYAAGSLGCVLVGSAGTPMIYGNGLADADYDEESLPYIRAGFAVCEYSMDGEVLGEPNDLTSITCQVGYTQFAAAGAGVVNIRNAVDYVLAKVPQVSPERIYIAGHSSAGSVALLGAAHEPRIKGCMAYCAPADLADQKARLTSYFNFRRFTPNINDFFTRSSPMTHVERLKCPVFMFYATSDSVVRIDQAHKLQARLVALGRPPTLNTVPSDDHYHSMTQQGIYQAITWLKTLPTEQNIPAFVPPPAESSPTLPNAGTPFDPTTQFPGPPGFPPPPTPPGTMPPRIRPPDFPRIKPPDFPRPPTFRPRQPRTRNGQPGL